MSEAIRCLNSETAVLIFGIFIFAGYIIHGYKTGAINLVIFYKDSNWTYCRKDSPVMFWAAIGFYAIMICFSISLL